MNRSSPAGKSPDPYRWNFSLTDRLLRWAYAQVSHTSGKAAALGKAVGFIVIPAFLLVDTVGNLIKDSLTAAKDGTVGLWHLRGRIRKGTVSQGFREGYETHFLFSSRCFKALGQTLLFKGVRDPDSYARALPSTYEEQARPLVAAIQPKADWEENLERYQKLFTIKRLPEDSPLFYQATSKLLACVTNKEQFKQLLAELRKLPKTPAPSQEAIACIKALTALDKKIAEEKELQSAYKEFAKHLPFAAWKELVALAPTNREIAFFLISCEADLPTALQPALAQHRPLFATVTAERLITQMVPTADWESTLALYQRIADLAHLPEDAAVRYQAFAKLLEMLAQTPLESLVMQVTLEKLAPPPAPIPDAEGGSILFALYLLQKQAINIDGFLARLRLNSRCFDAFARRALQSLPPVKHQHADLIDTFTRFIKKAFPDKDNSKPGSIFQQILLTIADECQAKDQHLAYTLASCLEPNLKDSDKAKNILASCQKAVVFEEECWKLGQADALDFKTLANLSDLKRLHGFVIVFESLAHRKTVLPTSAEHWKDPLDSFIEAFPFVYKDFPPELNLRLASALVTWICQQTQYKFKESDPSLMRQAMRFAEAIGVRGEDPYSFGSAKFKELLWQAKVTNGVMGWLIRAQLCNSQTELTQIGRAAFGEVKEFPQKPSIEQQMEALQALQPIIKEGHLLYFTAWAKYLSDTDPASFVRLLLAAFGTPALYADYGSAAYTVRISLYQTNLIHTLLPPDRAFRLFSEYFDSLPKSKEAQTYWSTDSRGCRMLRETLFPPQKRDDWFGITPSEIIAFIGKTFDKGNKTEVSLAFDLLSTWQSAYNRAYAPFGRQYATKNPFDTAVSTWAELPREW